MIKEFNIEDFKDSLVFCLREKFPTTKFYKDGTIKNYPCFYVTIENLIAQNIGKIDDEYYKYFVFFKIEYRISEIPNTITDFRSKMDSVGIKLIECLRTIKIYDKKYIPEITNNAIIDDIRILEGNVTLLVKYPQVEQEKMRNYDINTYKKG